MLKVANNKLVIGKEEYYPFSAEMHYFRVNKRYWSICFERIRKAGFRIISTCVPWNLHESAIGARLPIFSGQGSAFGGQSLCQEIPNYYSYCLYHLVMVIPSLVEW